MIRRRRRRRLKPGAWFDSGNVRLFSKVSSSPLFSSSHDPPTSGFKNISQKEPSRYEGERERLARPTAVYLSSGCHSRIATIKAARPQRDLRMRQRSPPKVAINAYASPEDTKRKGSRCLFNVKSPQFVTMAPPPPRQL